MPNSPASPRKCADDLLEVIPLLMRIIRARVREESSAELSMAQFRTLAFLGRNDGAMLGDVADFLSLTLPAASRLVDALVATGLADRQPDPADRRRVCLRLTPAGQEKYATVLAASADFLAGRLAALSDTERNRLTASLRSLHGLFAGDEPETRAARVALRAQN